MKKNLWVLCLLVFLPGCLNQTHYHELIGMVGDVKAMKEHNKQQDQRIDHMEKVLHQLRSSLHSDIKNRGVTVVKAVGMVKVTMPQAVLFASGSTRINHAGDSVLARIANGLKSMPKNGLIRIVGHSDSRPIGVRLRRHFKDNWELSAARAAAVARVFIGGDHIPANQIRVEGRAAMDAVADDATAAGRAKNRRIEIFIEKGT